jgi:hypothetical protein
VDVEHSERVERDLDRLIERQAEKNGAEREREALWAESVRRYRSSQQQDLRALWCEHYRKMRGVHYGLADEYDQKLRALENGHHEEEHNGHQG